MTASPQNHIEHLEDKYELETLGADLEAHWLGENVQRLSVRELANMANTQILGATLRDNGIINDEPIISSLATHLKNGEAPLATAELKERGVNVTAVCDDFIDYHVVYRYLTEERDIVQNRDETRFTSVKTLKTLEDRVKTTYRRTIRQLQTAGQLTGPAPVVDVDVGLRCRQCGTRTSAMIYLQSGSCPAPDCSENQDLDIHTGQ